MNRLVAGALCATTIVSCGSPAPTSSSPPSPATSFALTGHVSDATTSSPLAGALVEVVDGKNISRSATSDATGAFRIADLAMGGFTVRTRRAGYDSGFLGVSLSSDTTIDVRLTPVMTTLSGPWAGSMTFSAPTRIPARISLATLTQTGASVSSNLFQLNPGNPYEASFSGTLQDPSAIGSTTGIAGTLTLVETTAGRNPMDCRGTGAFTGTINWTRMSVTAAQVVVTGCGGTSTYSNLTLSLDRQQ
jgi:hypothetical protein